MVQLKKPILILGAGINGAAIGRELALNGVPVWIVDSGDIASGATSYSSRLIHGGLRYLEHREFDLVRESLDERTRLLRLAPQYVKPLRLFVPSESCCGGLFRSLWKLLQRRRAYSVRWRPRGAWLVRWGLWFYDTYANDPLLPRRATHSLNDPDVPRLNQKRFRWLSSYYDAQMAFPERFVLALLEDARRLAEERDIDFRIFTYHEARLSGREVAILPVSEAPVSRETTEFVFEPAAIVNATGAWVDHTLQRLHVRSAPLMGGTKGSHIITSNGDVRRQLCHGGVYAEAADGRPIFLLPFGQLSLIGTTDIPYDGDPRNAVASEEEIQYLLESTNRILDGIELKPDSVTAHYCGVRPLPYVPTGSPASITRCHSLEYCDHTLVPLFSVIGGKLTTCRALAELTVHTVLERFGEFPKNHSRDRIIPGGDGYPSTQHAVSTNIAQISDLFQLANPLVQRLWELYGTRTESVLQQCMNDSSYGSGHIDVAGHLLPVPLVRWVIRHEWVKSLPDLLERRLMLHYESELFEDCLHCLAKLLHEEGVISAKHKGTVVDHCVQVLSERYGRTVRR